MDLTDERAGAAALSDFDACAQGGMALIVEGKASSVEDWSNLALS